MEIITIIFLALGMSFTYILITLITSFFIYKEIRLPDIIDWKIVISNALLLTIPFLLIFWGLPLLINSVVISGVMVNIILFLVVSVVPTYEFLISPLLIIRNQKLREIEGTERIAGSARIFKVNKNFANAYAIGVLPNSKSVIISDDLIVKMSQKELDGIIAHELGHLKRNHLFKLYLSSLLALLIGYLSTFYFYPILEDIDFNIHVLRAVHGTFFYGLPMWLIPAFFQRRFEYQADSYASGVVGKENYIGSLRRLDEITKGAVRKGGITHPSLNKRIKNISTNE